MHKEFKFIDLTFVPTTHADQNEYEGGNLEALVDARAQSDALHGPNVIFIRLPPTQAPVERQALASLNPNKPTTNLPSSQFPKPKVVETLSSPLHTIRIPPF